MKIVREHIFEKFTDESDPIHDMGIGLNAMWDRLKNKTVLIFSKTLKTTGVSINVYPEGSLLLITSKVTTDSEKHKEFLCTHYKNVEDLKNDDMSNLQTRNTPWRISFNFFKEYFRMYNYKNVNEKFEEKTDPVRDLGIGVVRVYYYFYISEWAENRLIDFNNPNDVNLLNWLKRYKAVNQFNDKELYQARKLCKKAGLVTRDSVGDYHTPRMSKYDGPDIMLRVASTNDENKLFNKGVYQEWVWNFNDISSNPADHYKRWSDIKAKIKESYMGFTDDSDPIGDMGIGEANKFEKALYDFIYQGFDGFYSDLQQIVAKGSVIIIDWQHDPFEDNFRYQIKSSLQKSGFDKYVNADAISQRKENTFSSQAVFPLKQDYWYILDGIESIEKKRIDTKLHFKERWGHTYEIKINWE